MYNTPIPGYIHCVMENVLGWGRGSWIVQVVIDQEKREYNTSVHISSPERHGIKETGAEKLEAEGIVLSRKELRTILRLFKSRRFKHFLAIRHSGMCYDAGWISLKIFNTDEKVTLHSERFDFFMRDRLPTSRFQFGALWWTRGLKHIYGRMRDMA